MYIKTQCRAVIISVGQDRHSENNMGIFYFILFFLYLLNVVVKTELTSLENSYSQLTTNEGASGDSKVDVTNSLSVQNALNNSTTSSSVTPSRSTGHDFPSMRAPSMKQNLRMAPHLTMKLLEEGIL